LFTSSQEFLRERDPGSINDLISVDREGGCCFDDDGSPIFKDPSKITDRHVLEWVIQAADHWYCDPDESQDPHLYYFDDAAWHSNGENFIKMELMRLFKNIDGRGKLSFEKVTSQVKAQAMLGFRQHPIPTLPPYILAFRNCFVYVKEHTKRVFHKDFNFKAGDHECLDGLRFYPNQVPWNYDQEAKCPEWDRWLSEVVMAEDIPFLQEWVGYQFYRGVPEAAFLILTGSGQNGKSIFLEIMTEMLGAQNVTSVTLADLSYDVFAPAELRDKLANISDDIGNEAIKHAGKLKEVSSGARITAQRKFGHPFDFTPYAKITYSANEPPEIRDESDALKFRLKVVEFPFTFAKIPLPGQKQAKERKELAESLKKEIPGIINWSVQGLIRFLGNGAKFSYSRSTEEAWRFYQRQSKPVVSFLEECVDFTSCDGDWIEKEDLYQTFRAWLKEKKIKRDVSRDKFFKDLKNEGIEASRSREHGMKRLYFGLVIKDCSNVPSELKPLYNNSEAAEKRAEERAEGSDVIEYKKGWNVGTPETSPEEPRDAVTRDPPGETCLTCGSWQGSIVTQMALCCRLGKSTAQESTCGSWQPRKVENREACGK
jgi:P4 family phage/plasmid primase-like protien